jgi:hypothetical protein
VGAYGAAISTVLAVHEITRARRKLFLSVRTGVVGLTEDGKPADDGEKVATSFWALKARVVNIGARPIDVRDAGLVMRPRGRLIGIVKHSPPPGELPKRRERRRLRVRRSEALYVPHVDAPLDPPTLPRFLPDGESASCGWSLIKPPFQSHEPRKVFIEDVEGRRHKFRIPRDVRKEAGTRADKTYRHSGPLFGGAITETTPESIEEELWAQMGDRVMHLDQEEAHRRLKWLFAFSAFASRIREQGWDISKPLKLLVNVYFASEGQANEAAERFRVMPETEDLDATVGRDPTSEDRWAAVLTGHVTIDEESVSTLAECVQRVSSESGADDVRVGVTDPATDA